MFQQLGHHKYSSINTHKHTHARMRGQRICDRLVYYSKLPGQDECESVCADSHSCKLEIAASVAAVLTSRPVGRRRRRRALYELICTSSRTRSTAKRASVKRAGAAARAVLYPVRHADAAAAACNN